uniref:Uncharacterized protein n=1 Tax=Aegilops tauschii subsp. strangulata TaxID=200361 RepID=A0A453FYD9_AEGTS
NPIPMEEIFPSFTFHRKINISLTQWKKFYDMKQRTYLFLFLFIGFEMHVISFSMTFLFL